MEDQRRPFALLSDLDAYKRLVDQAARLEADANQCASVRSATAMRAAAVRVRALASAVMSASNLLE